MTSNAPEEKEKPKFNDATRSKRMFGVLNSTLARFKQDNVGAVGGKR
jgi:hypothetical protein